MGRQLLGSPCFRAPLPAAGSRWGPSLAGDRCCCSALGLAAGSGGCSSVCAFQRPWSLRRASCAVPAGAAPSWGSRRRLHDNGRWPVALGMTVGLRGVPACLARSWRRRPRVGGWSGAPDWRVVVRTNFWRSCRARELADWASKNFMSKSVAVLLTV